MGSVIDDIILAIGGQRGERYLMRRHQRHMRRTGVKLGVNVTVYGAPLVTMHENSTIEIGDRVVLCSDSQRTALNLNHPVKISTVAEGASLRIGADTGISGAALVSAQSITIGKEVLLGSQRDHRGYRLSSDSAAGPQAFRRCEQDRDFTRRRRRQCFHWNELDLAEGSEHRQRFGGGGRICCGSGRLP
jgi:hypothetical protein